MRKSIPIIGYSQYDPGYSSLSLLEECLREPAQRDLVFNAHHLPAGMHGQNAGSGIDRTNRQVGGEDRGNRPAPFCVGMFGKTLVRDLPVLEIGRASCRERV